MAFSMGIEPSKPNGFPLAPSYPDREKPHAEPGVLFQPQARPLVRGRHATWRCSWRPHPRGSLQEWAAEPRVPSFCAQHIGGWPTLELQAIRLAAHLGRGLRAIAPTR